MITPEQFLPSLFDSQGCERLFRVFRSMGTTQFTKINFTLLELIHMIGRVEVQTEIAYCKLDIEGIEFPHKRKEKTRIYELPTNDETSATVAKAKEEAFQCAQKFGMTNMMPNILDEIDEFEFKSNHRLNKNDEETYEELYEDVDDLSIENIQESHVEHNEEHEFDESYEELLHDNTSEVNPNSKFICVMDEYGKEKKILKSTFVWMITEPNAKMSNDRLKRFQKNSTHK